ncbi:MAG: hypothetical protein ACPGVH_03370 [Chitinophagales bacterium]
MKKIELLYEECGYKIRYEKGNFNPDFCILEQKKIVIINKYFTTDAKVSSLISILSKIKFEKAELTDESRQFYDKLAQLELKF